MSDSSFVGRARRRLRLEVERASGRLLDARRRRHNAGRSFQPIFVAGAIGSGTSLLAASLGQRLRVAGVALESAREVARDSCLWIDRVNHFPSIRAYEDRLSPGPDWSLVEAREDLQQLYRAKALDPTRDFIVDKGPNTNLVRAGFLAEAFPGSPFVLVFRDPVANIEGFRRKWLTFHDDALAENVRFWLAVHERFLDQTAAFPGRLVTVEYEALVADYEASLARLADRLGVPLAPEARPVAARAQGDGRGLRGVESGHIRVDRDANARSWSSLQATLDPRQIDEIRNAVAPMHRRLQDLARASGFAADAGGPT